MPVKLQVEKEGDDGDPADYLFEQDRITIGRGSGNDLTLPDQKVSTEHAEIRSDGGSYLLVDRDSKNKTYVDGRRVGEDEPYTLDSGDVFQVGDFKIEFAPLFMPSSEQTAYAEEDEESNPFEKYAGQLASALEGLAETYKFAPKEERDASFAEALQDNLDSDITDEKAIQRLFERLGVEEKSDSPSSSPQPAGQERASEDVIETLLHGISRMISIPNHFWREFTGKDLQHPSEKEALFQADPDELRALLLDDRLSEAKREERLEHLSDAVDSLLTHNMAMLAGYKKAVMAGSKEILQQVNPTEAVEEAEGEGGGVVDTFFGGGGGSELVRLKERWEELYHGEWGTIENQLFRPTYVETYVDRMAQAWDLEKAEILPEDDRA